MNGEKDIIVRPTQKDHSITYETVFDDGSNNLDFNSLTSTRKTKSESILIAKMIIINYLTLPATQKFKHHDDDENSIENDIAYESKPIKTSAATRVINSSGFLLIILCSLCQRYFTSSGSS